MIHFAVSLLWVLMIQCRWEHPTYIAVGGGRSNKLFIHTIISPFSLALILSMILGASQFPTPISPSFLACRDARDAPPRGRERCVLSKHCRCHSSSLLFYPPPRLPNILSTFIPEKSNFWSISERNSPQMKPCEVRPPFISGLPRGSVLVIAEGAQ